MNERIRELAEQASIDCELVEQWARDRAYIWTATDDELARFAELIIEECEGVVDWEAATAIKEHFEEKNT